MFTKDTLTTLFGFGFIAIILGCNLLLFWHMYPNTRRNLMWFLVVVLLSILFPPSIFAIWFVRRVRQVTKQDN